MKHTCTSEVKLTDNQLDRLASLQRFCDGIIRKYNHIDPDNDWVLTELSRISASVEQIWQDYV